MKNKIYKANKGEWSEFYTLLKLLAEQKLYAADDQLQKLEEIFYPVIKVITAKGSDKEISYNLDDSEDIKVLSSANANFLNVKRRSIKDRIYKIFDAIKSSRETTFEIPLAQEILTELGNPVIKGYSNKKSDIVLKIHDINTGVKPEVGFSIKSQIGGASTLLNSGESTNFIYEIENTELKPADINSIDTYAKVIDRLKALYADGARMKFIMVESKIFQENLMKVDTKLPELIAEMLLIYYTRGATSVKEIINELETRGFNLIPQHSAQNGFYEFKIKHLLMNVALGMTPATQWDGLLQVHGGYIIVREDGEIVCYHIYNQDAFRQYLYDNTKLETASTERYNFAKVYEQNGRKYMKLNLQIRFKD